MRFGGFVYQQPVVALSVEAPDGQGAKQVAGDCKPRAATAAECGGRGKRAALFKRGAGGNPPQTNNAQCHSPALIF